MTHYRLEIEYTGSPGHWTTANGNGRIASLQLARNAKTSREIFQPECKFRIIEVTEKVVE